MRVVIDLDGTICELKRPDQSYADVKVLPGAITKLKGIKAAGHTIIIQTARGMKTSQANQGKLMARVGKITLDWLAHHHIPYDEIYFCKPYGDLYIDDLACPFTTWKNFSLPKTKNPEK
jgi:capsule biosynthesis phosphatase